VRYLRLPLRFDASPPAMLKITLEAGAHPPDLLEEALIEAGACAVTLEDAADEPLYEPPPGAMPLWTRTRVVGLFPADADLAAVRADVHAVLGDAPPGWQVEPLQERDWERAWLDGFRPMRFGHRLWVCPSEYPVPDPAAVTVRLDPGLAFGTGTHATTALCLEWLDGAALQGAEVIDYGCGSGILGIAALKLGARQVWAVDNDPQALLATRDNAARNGVADRVSALAPDALPPLHADVLLANILAGPLIALAPRFAELVRPGGRVALSGILEAQTEEVARAYRRWFAVGAALAREGWVRIVGTRLPGA
jgi:ribosomal protein L11 methyltransferase